MVASTITIMAGGIGMVGSAGELPFLFYLPECLLILYRQAIRLLWSKAKTITTVIIHTLGNCPRVVLPLLGSDSMSKGPY